MVTSIARQSIIIKCLRQKSVLVGNYELYYAAGLLNNCFGLSCQKEMKPQELYDYIKENISSLEPQNENEEYLIKLVSRYEPLENYDEQMMELLEWGENEKDLWQINTTHNYKGE